MLFFILLLFDKKRINFFIGVAEAGFGIALLAVKQVRCAPVTISFLHKYFAKGHILYMLRYIAICIGFRQFFVQR